MFSKTNLDSLSTLSQRKRRFYDFLKENPVGVLSSVSAEGIPHGSVVYFDTDTKFNLSFITRADTRKSNNIRHNSHVTFTVFNTKAQTVLQIVGDAVEIDDSYEINRIAGAVLAASIRSGSNAMPPITKLNAGTFVAYVIQPNQARMAVYAGKDVGSYSDLFESIESYDLLDDSEY